MPVKNNIVGLYHMLRVGTQIVVADSFKRQHNMSASPKQYLQGTSKTRVLDIGGITESFDITAPILVGNGASVDGRTLANERLANLMANTTAGTNPSLPIMTSAKYSIGSDSSSVTIALKSDTTPNSQIISLTNEEVTALIPNAVSGTRVAKWFDFRVQLGGFNAFIQNGNIDINAQVDEIFFLGNPAIDSNIPTQKPYLYVSSLTISGGGTAVATITGDTDLSNVKTVTKQNPGRANVSDQQIMLQIYNGTNYVDLIDSNVVDFSSAVVDSSALSVSTKLITITFGFKCYVK
jgi:hypothetical protein